jgi:WD40 repeat protein
VDDSNGLKLWDTASGWAVGEWEGASSPLQWEHNGWGGGNGSGGPTAFDMSSDGRWLVLAERRNDWHASNLRLIDTASGRTRATRTLPEPGKAQQLTVGRLEFDRSADRVLVAFGDYQSQDQTEPTHKLARWDVRSNDWKEVGTLPMSSTGRGARANGRWFIGGHVFDARSGRRVLELVDAARWGFAVTPDGRLAAGLGRGTGPADWQFFDPVQDLRVWDTRTGVPLVHLLCPPLPPVPPVPGPNGQYSEDSRNKSRVSAVWPRALALHPSGRWLATADVRGVRIWDLVAGRAAHTFPVPVRTPLETNYLGSPATSLAFTPDGSRLATGMPDGTILLWPVPTLPRNPPRTDELSGLWADLMSPDAAKGWRAAWRLMDNPTSAVKLIRAKVTPAESVPAAELARLLNDADSSEFRRREAASRRLEAIIDRVRPAVEDAKKAAGASPELRERLQKVLAMAPGDDRPLPPAAAAQSRAVAVLENAGSAESRAVLGELAAGSPDAWLTREAHAALDRLKLVK